jgi:hypothetical protein
VPGTGAVPAATAPERSEDKHVVRFREAFRGLGRSGERCVLAFKIGFADPTGLRAAASDMNWYLVFDS